MALLTYQAVAITGPAQTYAAATAGAGGDTAAPDDRGWFEVVNASGGAITATVDVPGSVYGQARPDVAVSVPAGTTRKIGPLVADLADPTTGLVKITFSAVTSVTVAAVRI